MKARSYHKGISREDLVAAAERVLAAEGIKALSLRRVAREVGVVPSAVYNHFENLEALLVAVAADGYRQLIKLEKRGYGRKVDPGKCLRLLARDYLRFAAANPELYRLMFSPAVVLNRTDPELREAGDSSFGMSVSWWYGEGRYDPAKSAILYPLALANWSIVHGAAMQMIDGMVTVGTGRSTSVEALADVLMAALLDGVRGRLPENS
jgi:AcrR family transcriptional regulator